MAGENDFKFSLVAELSKIERDLANLTNRLSGVVGGLRETDEALKGTAAAGDAAGKSTAKVATSLAGARYALQDVSRTLLVAGGALLAFGLLPSKVAIDFEKDFANVQRTVEGAGQGVKNALKSLSTEVPVTFKSLTEIATIGGQLGIAKDDIVEFTKVVAKLSVTANVSSEEAGAFLGRFKGFGLTTAKEFEALGSSIVKVGVNSVATDSQIMTIASRISGIGRIAGLNAATLVGFAGGLASVGVQAYLAQGSAIRLVQKMQQAVSDGGNSLKVFAKVSGVSIEQFRSAFGTEKFNPIFQSFIKNLGNIKVAGADTVTILDELGLKGVNNVKTFTQLAAAPGVVAQAFSDAVSGIKEATELQRQYAPIASTTAAKFTELGNSILNIMDSVGSATSGPLRSFVSFLVDASKALGSFLNTSQGQTIALLATGFSVVSGVILILGGVAAKATSSFIGLVQAMSFANREAAVGTGLFSGLNASLAATGPAGARAAGALSAVGSTLRGLGVIGAVAAVSIGLNSLFDGLQQWTGARSNVDSLTKSLQSAGGAYKKIIDSKFDTGSGVFGSGAAKAAKDWKGLYDIFDSLSKLGPAHIALEGLDASGVMKFRDEISKLDKSISNVAGKDISQAAQEYNYLSSKLKEAGYSAQEIAQILPQSTAALSTHTEEVDKAAEATQKLADASGTTASFMQELQANTGMNTKGITDWAAGYAKSVSSLTDFNSVVKQVQDGLNAAAEAQAKAAGGNATAKQYYDGTSVSLQQFTAQLQANNASQEQWAQNLVVVASQYGPQAAQYFIDAGYTATNNSILQQLVNASPAQAAEFIAAQQRAADLAGQATAARILASGHLVEGAGSQISRQTADAFSKGIRSGISPEQLMRDLNIRFAANPGKPVVDTSPARAQLDGFMAQYGRLSGVIQYRALLPEINPQTSLDRPGMATGGHIRGPGTGTSDSVPMMLSNGEYVIKASRVRELGVGYLNALNGGAGAAPGATGMATGGQVSSTAPVVSVGVVELGPKSLGVLRKAVGQELAVRFGDTQVAFSANRGNARMNSRGAK